MEGFAVPLANNMEAIWAISLAPGNLGQALYSIVNGLILCVFMPQKTLGSIFAGITLEVLFPHCNVICCMHQEFFPRNLHQANTGVTHRKN